MAGKRADGRDDWSKGPSEQAGGKRGSGKVTAGTEKLGSGDRAGGRLPAGPSFFYAGAVPLVPLCLRCVTLRGSNVVRQLSYRTTCAENVVQNRKLVAKRHGLVPSPPRELGPVRRSNDIPGNLPWPKKCSSDPNGLLFTKSKANWPMGARFSKR